MQMYLAIHYHEQHVKLENFEYHDPETNGFGTSNGFYSADVRAIDEREPDLKFSLYTEGFFLTIKDNYEYQINQKETVLARLLEDYQQDIDSVSKNFFSNDYLNTDVTMTGLQSEKDQQKNVLILHEPYARSIDQRISILTTISITRQQEDIDALCKSMQAYDAYLETNCFSPTAYHFKIYQDDKIIDISNLTREVIRSSSFQNQMEKAKADHMEKDFPEIGYVIQDNIER